MSRVIKAAIWEENPHLIHTPEPPKPEAPAAEGDGLDEEARAHMLAEIADKVYRNMSKRAADMLREEIEFMGPVKIRDVEEAQQKVVNVIRTLEDKGEIVVSRGQGDEMIV